ncbi:MULTISPECIES: hypothetical protein [unclassified Pseudofrankia]|uniref:hypothetical protein n=1 Tax=unclassified Pseudofrankia TaxID=2994372 RepID=UPI0012FFAC86|nr:MULTISPECIES: hypothetical protein [unclassified Pseudofrankia]MDT3445800.1 hypothetical protein [Pseudofrankia sp. BMG5.37]
MSVAFMAATLLLTGGFGLDHKSEIVRADAGIGAARGVKIADWNEGVGGGG